MRRRLLLITGMMILCWSVCAAAQPQPPIPAPGPQQGVPSAGTPPTAPGSAYPPDPLPFMRGLHFVQNEFVSRAAAFEISPNVEELKMMLKGIEVKSPAIL